MYDEAVKTEREPEIPVKIDILRKMIEENAELVERLHTVLEKVMRGVPDDPMAERPGVHADTALGEKLAQCDEALYQCNDKLRSILDRLEI